MKSGWVEADAQALVDQYAGVGIGRDLALRVYTTRLLGRDPQLVLHGGGNTSVKTTLRDLLGETVEAICVKGSGADMAAIEPTGLPALRLDRLRKLRTRETVSDEEMVRVQRENLLDPMAPNPSVETLLHAASVCRSHPRQCRAEPRRPARWRGHLSRCLCRLRKHGALRHAGLFARQ